MLDIQTATAGRGQQRLGGKTQPWRLKSSSVREQQELHTCRIVAVKIFEEGKERMAFLASASRCGQHTPLLAAPEKILKGYQVEHYFVLVIIY